jgi:hypothetical protein
MTSTTLFAEILVVEFQLLLTPKTQKIFEALGLRA